MIVDRQGSVMYVIDIGNGHCVRRHVNHILLIEKSVASEPLPMSETVQIPSMPVPVQMPVQMPMYQETPEPATSCVVETVRSSPVKSFTPRSQVPKETVLRRSERVRKEPDRLNL